MKKILLLGYVIMVLTLIGSAQNVFNPDDPIVRYDKTKPYGSAQRPDTTIPGLQKWVSTPVSGVSFGTGSYDASSFKQYFINNGSFKMAFRVKFPYSYKNPDSAGKKYPINLFLHGGGEVGCPSNGGIYNNERPIWLGGELFKNMVDNNKFDGFLVYPQFVVNSGCFSGWLNTPNGNLANIFAMLDSMGKYVRADIDRVLITGLSGGAYGAWKLAQNYPTRIAKIMPSAGIGNASYSLVHIPIWFATGEKDPEPSPQNAQKLYDNLKLLGADVRYTQFAGRGHNMWYNHWAERDFIPQMNDMHKANPLIFFQQNAFCTESNVNAKLGISAGFYAYEWQKDGAIIASAEGNDKLILNPLSVISYTVGNEITVRNYGTYRVRFKRTPGSEWSVWSPKPAVITTKSTTQAVPIVIKGARSKVLPAPDGSTTVPLTMPDGFYNYRWFDASTEQQLDTLQVHEAVIGTYKSRYEEQFGCGTEFSPVFKVVDANGTPKPAPAQNLTAVPFTESINKLTWADGAGETGYEVYRATSSGGPYKFIRLTAANATSFNDSNLVKNTVYYYIVRAVSETGASVVSNESTVKTLVDNIPPTAPSNLANLETSSPTAQLLTWTASTDNIGVDHYDIFVNEEKLYSTVETSFTVTRLDSLYPYRFVVKAIDSSGNFSTASNQVTYLPPGTPAGTIPGIPSTVAAAPVTYNKISITWNDTTSNETGFEIFRSETINGTYVAVGTVDSNKVSFNDSALTPSKQYFYKIRAIGKYGQSDYSEIVNASTPALPATPVAPTEVTGTGGENNTVSISWNDNSTNETKYNVYRSTDGTTFTLIGTIPANTNAFTDNSVTPQTNYSYYVAGENGSGIGASSDTISIRAGNLAPVFSSLENLFAKTATTVTDDFSVTDDEEDDVILTVANKPSFVEIQTISKGNYRIIAKPSQQDAGSYTLTITATDKHGKAVSQDITITVADKNTRSVYINFGSANKAAAGAWNNWLNTRLPGDVLTSIKDENNNASNITVTSLSEWKATNNMGHISGNNSGVFPDDVLASGLADSGSVKLFKISGLNSARQYNLVFAGSQNEGITASATYSVGSQSAVLNSRYNTNYTANLNNLSPDGSGEIIVTITREASSPVLYLNGFAIEELEAGVQLLYPNNVYADALDRSNIRITWSDRTNNENATEGYELSRATDSLFTKDVKSFLLPANTTIYTDTALTPNTKYWYKVRAKNGGNYSDYSRITKAITPETIVYVNFNVTVDNAPAPWNNLESAPMFTFTSPNLTDHAGNPTNMSVTVVSEFNGEFTAGVNTGNNSGVVPDNVLRSSYWIDREQLSQMRVSGLNHSKRYRVGFVGSSSPPVWFRGNYTAKYTVHGKSVYLNSWQNSTKVVYINDLAPNEDGTLMLDFSTPPESGYAFNSGIIIEEFNDIRLQDTIPVDTIPVDPVDPIDTIPGTPVDPIDSVKASIKVFPNPVERDFVITFYNNQVNDPVDIEIYDPQGRRTYSRNYGARPAGNNTITISSYEARMRSGVYLVTLKMKGKLVKTIKVVKNRF